MRSSSVATCTARAPLFFARSQTCTTIGRPMVVHVCERAKKSGARAVHVATDDERIAQAVRAHGHSALMTRADHPSGTDRLAEAAKKLRLKDSDIVVNV